MSSLNALCVFCGSRTGNDPAFQSVAEALGRACAERDVRLVYGGGGIGLMGVMTQACVDAGGLVTGVIPKFLAEIEGIGEIPIDETVVVDSMHERKQVMFDRADAFAVLPGGLGTLDETIEMLTWKQLQRHRKPVVLLDVGGYWGAFEQMIARTIDGGFAHPKILELFTVVDDVDGLFRAIQDAPEPDPVVLSSHL